MKMLSALFFLMLPFAAVAEGPVVGISNCPIAWAAPTTGEIVQGYRLYWGSSQGARDNSFEVGTATNSICSAAGVTSGQQYMVVRSFNVEGESGDSNEFPFELVTAPPNPPSSLTIGP